MCTGSCKCVSSLCKGSCEACTKCCDAFANCLDNSCAGLGVCVRNICLPFTTVLNRPLGLFVYLAAVLSLPAVATGAMTWASLTSNDEACTNLKTLSAVDVAFALCNVAAALWFQHLLFVGLNVDQDGTATEGSADKELTGKELLARAWKIMLYDFGFLFYVLVFIGQVVYNAWGLVKGSGCDEAESSAYVAPGLLLAFCFLAAQFMCCWLFSQFCCCGGAMVASLIKPKKAVRT